MPRFWSIVGLGLVSGFLAFPAPASAQASQKMSAEDEAHFRALQQARKELQILEARVALKKAEIQKAEAEYMLRRLVDAAAEPATLPANGPKRADSEDKLVHQALDQALVMPFPDPAPLEEVIHYIRQATKRPGLPDGLPIFLDPMELKAAQLTMQSRVTVCHDNLPLRKSLTILLETLDLGYSIKDGMVVVHAKKGDDGPKPKADKEEKPGAPRVTESSPPPASSPR